MHILSIFADGLATPFQLRYRGDGVARAAYERVEKAASAPMDGSGADRLALTDDFGQRVSLNPWSIKAVTLEDIALNLESQLVMMKMQKEAQAKADRGSAPLLHAPAGLIGGRA